LTYKFVSEKDFTPCSKEEKAKTYFNTKGVPMQKIEELEKFRETVKNAAPTVAMEVGSESGGMLYEFAKLPSVKKIISVDLLNTLGG
jgi:tRNA G46 methylase TrmB